jgi:hypothetical protein
MKKFKCKCNNGWKPTKRGSLVEIMCFICNGKGWVDEETAIDYSISTKRNKYISPQMLRWKKKHKTCNHKDRTDLTKGKGEFPNEICLNCRTHWYKGKEYNPDEWDTWLEEDSNGKQ